MSTPTKTSDNGEAAVAALASAATAPLNAEGEIVVNDNNTASPAISNAEPAKVEATTTTTAKSVEPTTADFGDDMPKLISDPVKQAAKPLTQEPAKVEPTAEKTEATPAVQTEPATQQPAARDYNIFPEDMRDVMRKAPNAIYDAVKAQVEKFKQLETEAAELRKGALPPSYYEHPNAYQFDKGYQSAVHTLNQAAFEREHWTKQIAALRNGKESISSLEGFDGRTGQPIYAELKIKPEEAGDIEAKILENLTNIASATNQAQQQAAYVRQSFQQQYANTLQYLRGAEDKFFPDMKDMSKHTRKADYDYFTTQFLPPAMRSHPMASGLGKAYVAILNRDARINELTKEIESLKRGAAADKLAGPSAATMTGAATTAAPPAKAGQGQLSMTMFEQPADY